MPKPDPDRRLTVKRRQVPDRRGEQGEGSRGGERRSETDVEVPVERRSGAERRQIGERRSAIERRLALQSAADQIHGALKLLTRLAESEAGRLNEEQRRELEGAMLRLRFALERLEEE
jgi:acyl-CoA reductase-like NAD-dependent aldehyde dehydrogenase